MRTLERLVTYGLFVLVLVFQPLVVAVAQIDKPEDSVEYGSDVDNSFASPEDIALEPGEASITSFYDLAQFEDAVGRLDIGPDDLNYLKDGKVDVRITDYLIQLVLPEDLGGYGFDHIKVNRILKNYTSEGAGKYDREGVSALDESTQIVSMHNKGQAVDISEVGSATCKLIQKRHVGGSTTKWQKATPIKVAWQSNEGISRNPTPTAQSILGASGEMTAQSILAYMNQSGEMDYYIETARGLDMKTIFSYIGANIYLKNLGINQLVNDPLADGLLHVLGGTILEKNLPGIPGGIVSGNDDDDIRVAFAKAKIEAGLGLPAGSLRGYGWDNVLDATGKRHLESSLGLNTGYLDKRNPQEALKEVGANALIDRFERSDDGLNLMPGTVEAFKNNDPNASKMAGVTILSSALQLTPEQKQSLEQSVKEKKTPNIEIVGAPTGSGVTSDDIKGIFSSDKAKQKEVNDSLKAIGLAMAKQAATKATKGKYSGITDQLLNLILKENTAITLGEAKATAGGTTLAVQAGVNDNAVEKKNGKIDAKAIVIRNADAIAIFLNKEYDLKGSENQINSTDVKGMVEKDKFAVAEKIGGAQADKAFGWNAGTALLVMNNKKTLKDAAVEMFSNYVGKNLGLKTQGIRFNGDVSYNFGIATLAERLGIEKSLLESSDDALALIEGNLGQNSFYSAFNITDPHLLTDLRDNYPEFWDSESQNTSWKSIDIALGAPIGSVKAYLQGELTTKQLAHRTTQGSLEGLATDKIYDYFGINDNLRLSGNEISALIKVVKGGDDQTLEDIETGLGVIYKLVGRSVDGKANYSKDTFLQYIIAPDAQSGTKLLIDQGIRLIAQSVGANLNDYSFEDFESAANLIKASFGNRNEQVFGGGEKVSYVGLEPLRAEKEKLAAIPESQQTPEQRERLKSLNNNRDLTIYNGSFNFASAFFQKATGVPGEWRTDSDAFVRGDWKTGIAAASFVAIINQANQFLPAEGKLNYGMMRNSLIMDNEEIIQQKVDEINEAAGRTSYESEEEAAAVRDLARRQVLDESKKFVEYRVSDSLLRKINPAIPLGFSQTMFEGTAAERGKALESVAINHLDASLATASPLYTPGTLEKIYRGEFHSDDADQLIINLVNSSGPTFAGMPTAFVTNLYKFIKSSDRSDFYTNNDYSSMWGYFDGWLSSNLGIGTLPNNLAKSIYFASQNNWAGNVELKDSHGNILVPSLDALAKDFLINKLSDWGDKAFNLPAGTVYKAYQLYTAISGATKALAAASTIAEKAAASKSLSEAQNGLILFAIETGLNACVECQKFFGSVDDAIAAPPGTTQALISGFIANSLGAGPTGIYIAVAIYLFGVYKVEFKCPKPPQDLYAITEYDPPGDQYSSGIPYKDLPEVISSNPAPSQNPFDWDDTQPFTNGNDQTIWMGWSRFYVGKLLQATMDYGIRHEAPNKPLQVLTYRQANAEFFSPQVVGAFGEIAVGSDKYGIGFTQTSTKTTDWVHVGFGGIY